ncbi:MAG TPA: crotonase/enoyl-CoA hydratase family protein [Streptosporangiaceae bacterium]|nr:crotonase/enoyl-CoA hydratase family protein [Streptosporangiaceae bacterium]
MPGSAGRAEPEPGSSGTDSSTPVRTEPPARPVTSPARARTAVRVDRSGPVTTIILDRPEARNAVDGPTAAALAEAFADFDADADAAVAVLFGAGGTFCSGADLKAIGTPRGNRTEPDGPGPMGPSRMRLSKPVIAAVAGHAVAGGLELALWCDLRVAEEDAVFGVFSRRWGVPLIDGGTVRLPQLVGLGRALDLILTGRAVPAAEAYQMGLVSRIVRRGEAREEAERLALQIAAFPQACMRSDRASALDSVSLSFEDAMTNEFTRGQTALADPSLRAGLARFRGGAGRHGAQP